MHLVCYNLSNNESKILEPLLNGISMNGIFKIVLYKSNEFDYNDRIALRKFVNEDYQIVFFSSNKALSYLAWKVNAVQFVPYPLNNVSLSRLSQKLKYYHQSNPLGGRFQISNGSNLEVFDIDKVLYIEAKGNYSILNLQGNKKIVLTKKISELEIKFSNFCEMERIGKSYMVNLKNIVQVKKDTVLFKDEEGKKLLNLSYNYILKLKKIILWHI
jgi:DNA-binding LytR/AlgR family response regulator